MKESKKFYYIDKDGNKKKYVGKIISNKDSYNGILTTVLYEDVEKPLIYHAEVKEVKGNEEYYSYIDKNGEEAIYLDVVKRDDKGNLYFMDNERQLYKLIYHPKVEPAEEYYTYLDAEGNECRYSGNVIYDKGNNTYTGIIDK